MSAACLGLGLWSYRGVRGVEWQTTPAAPVARMPAGVGVTPAAAGFACPSPTRSLDVTPLPLPDARAKPVARLAPGESCTAPKPVANQFFAANGRLGFQRFQPLYWSRAAAIPPAKLVFL